MYIDAGHASQGEHDGLRSQETAHIEILLRIIGIVQGVEQGDVEFVDALRSVCVGLERHLAAVRQIVDHLRPETNELVVLGIGTVAYRLLEDWSWVDSFYFSAIAVTTVGFGDFSPTTDGTKLFTVAYVFFGISLIGVVLNERLRRHATQVHERRTSPND